MSKSLKKEIKVTDQAANKIEVGFLVRNQAATIFGQVYIQVYERVRLKIFENARSNEQKFKKSSFGKKFKFEIWGVKIKGSK
jgi:hypothetical protein